MLLRLRYTELEFDIKHVSQQRRNEPIGERNSQVTKSPEIGTIVSLFLIITVVIIIIMFYNLYGATAVTRDFWPETNERRHVRCVRRGLKCTRVRDTGRTRTHVRFTCTDCGRPRRQRQNPWKPKQDYYIPPFDFARRLRTGQ